MFNGATCQCLGPKDGGPGVSMSVAITIITMYYWEYWVFARRQPRQAAHQWPKAQIKKKKRKKERKRPASRGRGRRGRGISRDYRNNQHGEQTETEKWRPHRSPARPPLLA